MRSYVIGLALLLSGYAQVLVWQETFEVPLTLPPGLYYLHTDAGTARLYLMP